MLKIWSGDSLESAFFLALLMESCLGVVRGEEDQFEVFMISSLLLYYFADSAFLHCLWCVVSLLLTSDINNPSTSPHIAVLPQHLSDTPECSTTAHFSLTMGNVGVITIDNSYSTVYLQVPVNSQRHNTTQNALGFTTRPH
jgi:hypothetical protein